MLSYRAGIGGSSPGARAMGRHPMEQTLSDKAADLARY
jgi:hypothetical protein